MTAVTGVRHTGMQRIAQVAYAVPGSRPAVCGLVRAALQRSPLQRGGKQRLFNFFASEVAPRNPVTCQVPVPGAPARCISSA